MTLEELRKEIARLEVVTVGAAAFLCQLSREEIIAFVEENKLKIYDEENCIWYNETAKGHC